MQKNNAFKEYLKAKLTTTILFLFYFYYRCYKSRNNIQWCIYFVRNAVLLTKLLLSETVFIITQSMYNAVIKRSRVYAGNLSLLCWNFLGIFRINICILLAYRVIPLISDIIPSSLINFEILNSILWFSIFSQTVQF